MAIDTLANVHQFCNIRDIKSEPTYCWQCEDDTNTETSLFYLCLE